MLRQRAMAQNGSRAATRRVEQRGESDATAAGLVCSQSGSFQPIPSTQYPNPRVSRVQRQGLGVLPPQRAPSPPLD